MLKQPMVYMIPQDLVIRNIIILLILRLIFVIVFKVLRLQAMFYYHALSLYVNECAALMSNVNEILQKVNINHLRNQL